MKRSFLLVVALFIPVIACTRDVRLDALKHPYRRIENFHFNPSSSIASRVSLPPESVLKYLNEIDGRQYRASLPDKREMAILIDAIKSLSPGVKNVLQKRLLGIYFVDDFMTGGLTDWVLDEKGDLYAYMVFRSSLFEMDVSEFLTYRENTAFQNSSNDLIAVLISEKQNAMYYIMHHETAHVYDYSMGVTPYTEPAVQSLIKHRSEIQDPAKGIWKEYRVPVPDADFALRKNASFYGFRGKPDLTYDQAMEIYNGMYDSPFVSLYGSMSWAEDFAELVAYRYLLQKKKFSCEIVYIRKGEEVVRWRPADNPVIQFRLDRLSPMDK